MVQGWLFLASYSYFEGGAIGVGGGVFDFLFGNSWSNAFWTNFLFIVVIAAALAWGIKGSK